MDTHGLTDTVMHALFGATRAVPYRDGFLVHLPLTYSDGDTVTVGVFPTGSAFRVTDRAEAQDRLEESGVLLDRANRASELTDAMRRSARLSAIDSDEAEVAHLTAEEDLGSAIMRVGELAQRIEHLRWIVQEAPVKQYREALLDDARALSARHGWALTPRAPIELASGARRQVTASVEVGKRTGYLQALANTDRYAAIEHAFFVFSHLDVEPSLKLAVLDAREQRWKDEELEEVAAVSTVVQYHRADDLEKALNRLGDGPRVLT